MTKEAEKRWRDHSEFQREFAEYVGYAVTAPGPARVDAVAGLVEFLLFEGMKHEHKHCESNKTVPPINKRRVREGSVPSGCNDCSQEGISTKADVVAMWRENERYFEAGP